MEESSSDGKARAKVESAGASQKPKYISRTNVDPRN